MESSKIKLVLISLLLLITGCGNNKVNQINKDELKKLLEKDNTVLIDVRTKEEYESGNIEKSINIPLDEIDSIKIKKNKNIVVYCRSGVRSETAANKLIEMGYTRVYDFGSIDNW